MVDLQRILKVALERQASDIHLKAGLPPVLRVHGKLVPLKDERRLMPEDTRRVAFSIMNDWQREQFNKNRELDMAYGISGLGRFRVNIFSQRDSIGLVLRTISINPPTIRELNLPPILEKIAMEPRGLVLVTGTTGCGKSTTLAAMINHINNNRNCHVLTIEDPIEFLHRDKKAIINQREVGQDTLSFASALRVGLRQDPDVIMVGEMRDLETIEISLTAAETGHLVLSTLHTMDAQETINRIVSVFPSQQQQQVRFQLQMVLKAIISQRLVMRADGRGRVPATEVMLSTARIKECIANESKTGEISDAIAQGHATYGMHTFDQSLLMMFRKGMITYDEALRNASNPDDFALKVSGISGTSEKRWKLEDEEEEGVREEVIPFEGPHGLR
jgi:twitching motility protein PilT